MLLEEPHISKDDLMKINIPVLVLAGEKDLIKEENTRFIAENISNSITKCFYQFRCIFFVTTMQLYPSLLKGYCIFLVENNVPQLYNRFR
jgi:hypothetical protein